MAVKKSATEKKLITKQGLLLKKNLLKASL